MHGIPGNLSVDYAQKWATARVSPKRLKHIEGVARVSQNIALAYGCDPYLAELAAWLHDACKEARPHELVEQARSFNLPLSPLEEQHGHLLHGPVAACLVRAELGVEHEDLLSAIAEHTLGAAPMCKLSELLYLADCLEDNRPQSYTAQIWHALSLEGEINVDQAIVTATDLNLKHLLETSRPIHPRTVDVRNFYLARTKKHPAREQTG